MITTRRAIIVNAARTEFIATGKTNNISEAMRLYIKAHSEECGEVPVFISTPEKHQLRELMKLERPTCETCGGQLFLRQNAVSPEGREYATAWLCKDCGRIEYSDKSVADWLRELKHAI